MGKIVTKSVDLNANILYLKHEIVADTNKTQARIEFRNMAYGTITAVKFEAQGYNAFGDVIQIAGKPTFDIVAQDLVIAPKRYTKLDSVLPSQDIRKLDLKLKQVCYANGRIVDAQTENIITYQIESIDENPGTLNQQEKEERAILKRRLDEAVCFSKHHGRNWVCICGYLNKNTDATCRYCGCKEIEMLEEYSKESIDEKIEIKKRRAAAEQAKRKAEQIKFEAEQRRQKEEQERQEAERRAKRAKRNKTIAGIVGIVSVCGIGGYFVNEKVIIPNNKYNHAIESMNAGQYENAISELKELGEYKDASKKIDEARKAVLENKYVTACKLLDEKSYDEAIVAFNAILEYKDSGDKILEAQNDKKQMQYDTATILMDEGKYDQAIKAFKSLGDFSNSKEMVKEVSYQQGCKLLDEYKWSAAIVALEKIKGYKDADNQLKEAKYQKACGYLTACKYEEAMEIFAELGDYKDSVQLINDLKEYN